MRKRLKKKLRKRRAQAIVEHEKWRIRMAYSGRGVDDEVEAALRVMYPKGGGPVLGAKMSTATD